MFDWVHHAERREKRETYIVVETIASLLNLCWEIDGRSSVTQSLKSSVGWVVKARTSSGGHWPRLAKQDFKAPFFHCASFFWIFYGRCPCVPKSPPPLTLFHLERDIQVLWCLRDAPFPQPKPSSKMKKSIGKHFLLIFLKGSLFFHLSFSPYFWRWNFRQNSAGN